MLVMMLPDPWTVICYLDCDDAGADAARWDMLQDGCDCLDDAGDMLSGLFELEIARPRLLLPFLDAEVEGQTNYPVAGHTPQKESAARP